MNFVGKTCGVSRVKVKALGCLFSLCSILAASAALAQTAAPPMEIAGGDARYCEIFLITGEPGKLEADVYNTLTLNDCPADKWKALNPEALKEEFKVSAVFKNGPRFWVVYKTFVLKTGKMYTDKRNFGGIEAFYAGTVKLPPDFGKGLVAYQEGSIARDTRYMFSNGKPVFLLIDPNGGTWVMQAYSHIVDNSLTLESLSTLDRKLKLPQGWQYRVKTLDRDLTVQPVNGVARIVQDDLQSTYNLCFETACSYDPK